MNHKAVHGFTLIELMLSMSFISVMLIAIALCVIQMSTIYNRGETLRQVNQAVRTISTDMEDTIAGAYPFDVNQATIDATGRLCTGQYSYVWSTPDVSGVPGVANNYDDGTIVRFARVRDAGATLCATPAPLQIVKANATELLEAGDRTLVVHSFKITQVGQSDNAKQRLYTIKMMVGTNNTAAIETTATDTSCRPPSDSAADLTYCAVNDFTITVRAGMG